MEDSLDFNLLVTAIVLVALLVVIAGILAGCAVAILPTAAAAAAARACLLRAAQCGGEGQVIQPSAADGAAHSAHAGVKHVACMTQHAHTRALPLSRRRGPRRSTRAVATQ